MLSDQNARNLAVDIAKMKNDGVISAEDLVKYDRIFGQSLIQHPEFMDDALELYNKYKDVKRKKRSDKS